jgi:acetylornithine/succinyldiaminopimelate/putrescine aminotransferase
MRSNSTTSMTECIENVIDFTGRKFLDFCAGIAVSSLGHSDPDWYKSLVDAGKVRADR